MYLEWWNSSTQSEALVISRVRTGLSLQYDITVGLHRFVQIMVREQAVVGTSLVKWFGKDNSAVSWWGGDPEKGRFQLLSPGV